MHFLFAVSGFSGIGKDEFCKPLIERFEAVQIGLADPAKRHMADVYGFTEEQLFGPSKMRNRGDLRYPKSYITDLNMTPWTNFFPACLNPDKKYWSYEGYNMDDDFNSRHIHLDKGMTERGHLRIYFVEEGDPEYWLSPREALQTYCEGMNQLYLNTWIRKGIENHRKFAADKYIYKYTKIDGLKPTEIVQRTERPNIITCFADLRHWHEVKALRAINEPDCIPVLVRIRSKRISKPPYNHRSEVEQTTIPDSEFDFVIDNDGTVEDLNRKSRIIATSLLDKTWVLSKTRFL